MMKLCNLCVALCMLAILINGICASDSLQVNSERLIMKIEPFGRDSLRVRIGPVIRNDLPGALLSPRATSAPEIVDTGDTKHIKNGNIKASVDSKGLITFSRVSDSEVFLEEISRMHAPSFISGTYVWNVSYASDANEAIYGLGEHQTGKLNNKGQFFDFHKCLIYDISLGSQIMIPFYVSNRGYGYLWNLPSFGYFASYPGSTNWTSESAYQLDFWVTTYSENADSNHVADILSNYVDATGHAPELPYYATGFWQSKNRYSNQSALLAAADGYIQRGIPISIIVVDNIRTVPYGNYDFGGSPCWPNPKQMAQDLASYGIETMVSVWPLVQYNSVNNASFANYHVHCPPNQDFCVAAGAYTIDATIPAARKLWWQKIYSGFVDNGVKNFFLDSAEPVQLTTTPPLIYSIGHEATVGMIYPIYYSQTFQDGLQSSHVTGVSIIRSAWAGSQRHGAAVWSGDTFSTYGTLANQVRVGLNMAMSGIVWWTSDIGGYQGGNIYDPVFQDLIVRWFQWGAFCPIFRNHGFRSPLEAADTDPCMRSGAANEIWEFGDNAYAAISIVISIREQLRPYIAEHLKIASKNGTPIMRPLWFDFPKDAGSENIEDQFMFGPKYMVAPILAYNTTQRSVYFPRVANSQWVHWFTKTNYTPGSTVTAFPAPLNTFPLFFLRKIVTSTFNS